MATQDAETEGGRNERKDETERPSAVGRAVSRVGGFGRNGTGATVAGGVLLARALRSMAGGGRRRTMQGLVGAALLGVGLRQRRSGRSSGGEKTVSDDAHAARERNDVLSQDEENPRGVSGEADVETQTDPDEGRVTFTDEQDSEPQTKPHLEGGDAEDPRLDEEGQEEIDISEAAMADEASEAAGPTSQQAQPAQTEDTEPEPSPTEDASHMQADVPDDEDEADDEDESDDDQA